MFFLSCKDCLWSLFSFSDFLRLGITWSWWLTYRGHEAPVILSTSTKHGKTAVFVTKCRVNVVGGALGYSPLRLHMHCCLSLSYKVHYLCSTVCPCQTLRSYKLWFSFTKPTTSCPDLTLSEVIVSCTMLMLLLAVCVRAGNVWTRITMGWKCPRRECWSTWLCASSGAVCEVLTYHKTNVTWSSFCGDSGLFFFHVSVKSKMIIA